MLDLLKKVDYHGFVKNKNKCNLQTYIVKKTRRTLPALCLKIILRAATMSSFLAVGFIEQQKWDFCICHSLLRKRSLPTDFCTKSMVYTEENII